MCAMKAQKRKTVQKTNRVKERRPSYTVRTALKKATRVRETQLEFHIRLPAGADAEEFADKLIELVEFFKGTVGGGVVAAEA